MNKETLSTSEKEIPKHRNALSEKYKQEDKKIGSEPEPLNPAIGSCTPSKAFSASVVG